MYNSRVSDLSPIGGVQLSDKVVVMMRTWLAVLLGCLVLLSACSKPPGAPEPEPAPAASAGAVQTEPVPKPDPQPSPVVVPTGGPASVASAVSKAGPWLPLDENRFVPLAHQWVRYQFDQPQDPARFAQSGLPVEWEDPRTALLAIGLAPPQLLPLSGHGEWLFRGAPPVLLRVSPAGAEHMVASLDGLPERLWYNAESGEVRFQELARLRSYFVNVATGQMREDGSRIVGGHGYGEIIFHAPGRNRVAELFLPDFISGEPRVAQGTLVVRDGGQEILKLERWLPFYQERTANCWPQSPAGAWHPGGNLLTVTSTPSADELVLLALDAATGQSYLQARQPRPQGRLSVTWSPDGRYLTFGTQLLEPKGDRVIAADLPASVLWSQDSRFLLTSRPRSGQWGELALIEAATGQQTALGYGWALGWTPGGEALIARWDTARLFPLPQCP